MYAYRSPPAPSSRLKNFMQHKTPDIRPGFYVSRRRELE